MASTRDIDEIARSLPDVVVTGIGPDGGRPVYQVHGKSFVFFRTKRPDAVDPVTGERLDDVVCIWTPTEQDKLALIQDPASPFFTTPHFDGYRAVLVRESALGRVSREELTEIITDAWLSRAPKRLARSFLDSRGC